MAGGNEITVEASQKTAGEQLFVSLRHEPALRDERQQMRKPNLMLEHELLARAFDVSEGNQPEPYRTRSHFILDELLVVSSIGFAPPHHRFVCYYTGVVRHDHSRGNL